MDMMVKCRPVRALIPLDLAWADQGCPGEVDLEGQEEASSAVVGDLVVEDSVVGVSAVVGVLAAEASFDISEGSDAKLPSSVFGRDHVDIPS